MESDIQLINVWYDSWLVIVGCVVALVLTVLVSARSSWQTEGLLLKTVMVLAVVVTLPLTMIRLEINPQDPTVVVGYLSIAGVIVSLVVGLPYLLMPSRFARIARREPEFDGIVTPAQAPSMASDMEGATRTLGGDIDATVMQEPGSAGITGAGEMVAAAPTEAPPAWLVFKSGPRTGQSIPLNPGVTSIGRSSDNDVVVDDAAVSREHATIVFQNGEYVVEDAGSSSGTLVEGSTQARTVLVSGSAVQVGETELVFMQAGGATAQAPTGGPGSTGGAGPVGGQPGETMMMDQAPSVMAWLAVTTGPDKGKIFQLKDGDTIIGREQGTDVTIADSGVSRRHAMIKHQDGKFLLLDLGSSGGTKANGQPIGGKILATGGVISIGQTQLFMVDVEAQAQDEVLPASSAGATMVMQPETGGGVLIARSGPDAGKSFTLVQGENAIGRDLDCQILLTDQAVSRQHAIVRRQGDSYMVYDLGSRGGTSVDGDSVTGSGLTPGDVITIGRTEIVLMQPQG
ncbi:MAG: FHA domain-containing protein [Dehalococcoidia bacterium]